MGYALCHASCAACHQPVAFNPHLVPSIRINGVKEPLCESCANRWNTLHPENAQVINPRAYEPMDESEL